MSGRARIVGVGTVALDTVETPAGSAKDVPGGSALYFAAAASTRTPVAVVGVTGEDYPTAPLEALAARGVDLSGLVRHPLPTFRWQARYDASGERHVLSVHRGGIVKQSPSLPAALRDPDHLFLGSTDPNVQARVLDEAGRPGVVLLDTMSHWIRGSRVVLAAILPRVDILILSEDEVHILAGDAPDEGTACAVIHAMGPKWVVMKKGARGACARGPEGRIDVPAVPVDRVVDPTGAGDAFAGGLVAVLSERGEVTRESMEEAMRYGAAMGAKAVSAFSFSALLDGA